ncbi:zf-HC2 domain-containing protein [Mycobacterium talmoniae]|uniref:Putative zinc-finger domain-containing protein n=1 Tax=Mycobacterium talmoniae TaxID=1858794 RepID=A0A1S1NRM0_9MYCO|nr:MULTISPECIES: zf-HC2 domain-containing protein [Mycobacterium]OHV05591.1 hypothetical protein BKN37_05250 [Mycobacterium talmoniae]TDH55490.1 hypothetical protein E2F47_09780 [Mycobacterium eburneum]
MDCDVAREALSARIDGEPEPVPSARVDEHVRSCPSCTAWYTTAREQAVQLRSLAGAGSVAPVPGDRAVRRFGAAGLLSGSRRYGLRAGLALLGLIQIWLAVAQAAGMDFGLVAAHHGAATGAHLLNESTAWCAALGIATVAAAFLPPIAAGLACVLVAYVGLLGCYVVADAVAGQVTTIRIASHLPVAAAAVLAVLVWHASRRDDPPPRLPAALDDRPPQVRSVHRDDSAA